MKTKFVMAGLIGVALVFGLMLTGCSTDTPEEEKVPDTPKEENVMKFEGTWKTGTIGDNNVAAQYEFTGTNFIFSSNDDDEKFYAKGPISGTFVFTALTITFTVPGDNPKTWALDYTFSSGVLSLSNSSGDNPTKLGTGTLTKQ